MIIQFNKEIKLSDWHLISNLSNVFTEKLFRRSLIVDGVRNIMLILITKISKDDTYDTFFYEKLFFLNGYFTESKNQQYQKT